MSRHHSLPYRFPEHTPKHKLEGQTAPRPSVTNRRPPTRPQDPFPIQRDKPSSFTSPTPRATPPSYTENFGTRHRRPTPCLQTPERSRSPALPLKAARPRHPEPTPQGPYQIAAGSPARQEVAAPAPDEPSWSAGGHGASWSRPGHQLHLSGGQPSPEGGARDAAHIGR